MSNIISKIRQKIATRERNKFAYDAQHITSTDFMKLGVSLIKECTPGEELNVKMTSFTRLAPMIKPMYGKCRLESRAFFIPSRTIMKGWNEFITDAPYEGTYLECPKVSLHNLASMLASFSSTGTSAMTQYDYKVGSGNTGTRYRFNYKGRQAWKILNSLGYKFPIGYWLNNTSTTEDGAYVSALPLLALCKVYDDWYKAQAYGDATFYGLFDTTVSTTLDNVQKLTAIFNRIITVNYDKDDLFVSAWDRPVSPNNGVNSSTVIKDVTNDTTGQLISYVQNSTTVTSQNPTSPTIKGSVGTSANASNVTQFCIDALKALTDYQKRHQLAGSLAFDRLAARFGIRLDSAKVNRSVYLGKQTADVQIADVMGTANGTDGNGQTSTLGEYAGKGIGYSNGAFHYKTDEYGFFIIISTILPHVGYVQGMAPHCTHMDRLSFWTPEFDGLGVTAIPRKQLLSSYNGGAAEDKLLSLTPSAALEGVFGYAPNYYEYKSGVGLDNLTGDFAVPSMNGSQNTEVWHLNRMFNPSAVTITGISHNLDFVSATDASQYDRVFAAQYLEGESDPVDQNYFDHFYVIHHFEITSWQNAKKLFEDYDFDGGKETTIEINGTQLN